MTRGQSKQRGGNAPTSYRFVAAQYGGNGDIAEGTLLKISAVVKQIHAMRAAKCVFADTPHICVRCECGTLLYNVG
jgi:hypothetical protein